MEAATMDEIENQLTEALKAKDSRLILQAFQNVSEDNISRGFLDRFLKEVDTTFEDKTLLVELFKHIDDTFTDLSGEYIGSYLPIELLMNTKEYELAFRLFQKCEDENCDECTPEYVYFYEGKCLYLLGKYDDARWRLQKSIDGDHDEMEAEAQAMIENIDRRTFVNP